MDTFDLLHALQLNDQFFLYEKIDSVAALQAHTFVFDRQGILQLEHDAIEFQLVRKTLLVCRFEQTRPQLSMDRKRAPNDPIR